MSFGARACINLGAIQQNFQLISKKAPGARVMAVIKADGYGHGMIRVAGALAAADAFAVARVAEGIRQGDSRKQKKPTGWRYPLRDSPTICRTWPDAGSPVRGREFQAPS